MIGSGISINCMNIKDCSNYGNINVKTHGGGIFSDYVKYGKIINCYNQGNIYRSSGGYIGGISSESKEIINCFSLGNVGDGQAVIAGGITGSAETLENCYNTGSVTGNMASGITTQNGIKVYRCYNSGNITGKNAPTGGIVGLGGGTMANCIECYNTGDITSLYGCGEIVHESFGKTENCFYLQKEKNANANGATPMEKKDMDEIMDMKKFVDLLNAKVDEYNSNVDNIYKLKKWQLKDGHPELLQ